MHTIWHYVLGAFIDKNHSKLKSKIYKYASWSWKRGEKCCVLSRDSGEKKERKEKLGANKGCESARARSSHLRTSLASNPDRVNLLNIHLKGEPTSFGLLIFYPGEGSGWSATRHGRGLRTRVNRKSVRRMGPQMIGWRRHHWWIGPEETFRQQVICNWLSTHLPAIKRVFCFCICVCIFIFPHVYFITLVWQLNLNSNWN